MHRANYVWLLLAAVCGALLFHTSQRVTDGSAALSALEDGVTKERESIRVLEAEWSYLNQPDRLEKLARAHLHLEPMKGRQFVSAGSLAAWEPLPAAAEPEAAAMAEQAVAMAEIEPGRALNVPPDAALAQQEETPPVAQAKISPVAQAKTIPVQQAKISPVKKSGAWPVKQAGKLPAKAAPPPIQHAYDLHVPRPWQPPAPPRPQTAGQDRRDFGDVMKSLEAP